MCLIIHIFCVFSYQQQTNNNEESNSVEQNGFYYIDFFFMAEKADNQGVWSQLGTLLTSKSTFCDFLFDPSYQNTNSQPGI